MGGAEEPAALPENKAMLHLTSDQLNRIWRLVDMLHDEVPSAAIHRTDATAEASYQ
jgi:hypothetical protein